MNKILKKAVSGILLATMCFGCFGITGCKREPVSDGEFIYEYRNPRDSDPFYVIIGSTEEGKKYKENVYVPTHYNGVPITLTFTTESGAYMGTTTTYSMQVNCKNLYFNYIQEYTAIFYGKTEYIFYPKTTDQQYAIPWELALKSISDTVYVGDKMYEIAKNYGFNSANSERFEEIEGYITRITRKNSNNEIVERSYIIKANVNYHFNFDNSPNEDYFFINDFEWGGLIEDTPYEPIREGYTFAGWYKEPECVNAWNFEKDKLPIAMYNEEGYVTNHTVTHLYAKWIEN